MTCAQVTEQLDKYVLGTLAAEISSQISQHLGTCTRCSKTLAQTRSTADVLALVTEAAQPPATKKRLLNAIGPAPQTMRRSTPQQPLHLQMIFEQNLALVAVILALLVIGAFVIWEVRHIRDQLNTEQQIASQLQAQLADREELLALLTDKTISEYSITGTDAAATAAARFYANAQKTISGLIVWNLPTSPAGTVYQVWLIDNNGAYSSGGVFRVGSGGSASVLVRALQPMGSYRSLVVSVEPVRGNHQPSGTIVLSVSF